MELAPDLDVALAEADFEAFLPEVVLDFADSLAVLTVTLVVLSFGLALALVLFLVAGFLEVDFASGM